MDGMETFSVPKVEVNEQELAKIQTAAEAVMIRAVEVAADIDTDAKCAAAEKWASQHLTFAKDLRKVGWLAEIRDTWHREHDRVCKIIKKYSDPHEIAVRTIVDPAIILYCNKKEQQRLADQKRLQDEAKKRDEDERLARAVELEKQGNTRAAEVVLEKAGQFQAPILPPTKLENSSMRKRWKVKRDMDEERTLMLIKGIADGRVSMKAVEVDYSWLDKQAQQMDGNLKYPGVECYEDQGLSHGRAA